MIKTCQGAGLICQHEEGHTRRLLRVLVGHEIGCRLEIGGQKILCFLENALFGFVLVSEVNNDLGELARGSISAADGIADDPDLSEPETDLHVLHGGLARQNLMGIQVWVVRWEEYSV